MGKMGDDVRAAYARLTAEGGELPTSREVARCARVSVDYTRDILNRSGLAYRHAAGAHRANAANLERREERNAAFRFGSRTEPAMMRVLEIMQGNEAEEDEGWTHRPGERYEVTDRIMLTCPVCGARKLIAPRMWPYWLRNRAGKAIFVCREACAGRFAYKDRAD